MNWENLFGQETITYGFDKLTQDDFCTAIIVFLAIITFLLLIIAINTSRSNNHNTEDNNNDNVTTLMDSIYNRD